MKRESDFSLTAKSVWTEKPRKSGKTDLARTREQRFGALDSLDGEQVGKVRLLRIGSTPSARRTTFSKFHTAVIVQWQFGCFRRDATIHELGSAREKFSRKRKTKSMANSFAESRIYVCCALIP